jgi:predicted nucleic acid-binding Zn ribbon protein
MDTCPACSCKTAKRLVSASNFILKGGGWYADLYSAPSKNKDRKSNGGEARTPAKTTSESKSSDSSNAATPSSTSSTPTSTPSSGN